jgi:hypothetical protein
MSSLADQKFALSRMYSGNPAIEWIDGSTR